MTRLWIALMVAVSSIPAQAQEGLAKWLSAPHRSRAQGGARPVPASARDARLLRRRADSTVVEILPGSGGYYMEILAPYLKQKAATSPPAAMSSPRRNTLRDHQKLLVR
jgi:predicted methyltransferase